MYIQLEPLLALVAGILVLVVPQFLRFIVGGYLVIVGLAGLFNF